MKIGIVGIGAIGKELCLAIDSGVINAELAAIYDRDIAMAEGFASKLKSKPRVLKLQEMLDCVDLIVEAASQAAVREIAIPALKKGKDILIMSTGALLDEKLFQEIKNLAVQNNCKIYIPSGAILGIDGLRGASLAGVDSVSLTVIKPPAALSDAPYVKEKKIDLSKIKQATLLFEGLASEAVRFFPANVNVAATLSLAASKQIKVRVIADPSIDKNLHKLEIKGRFGEMEIFIKNLPSPCNPRTSYLAVLSAIATLKRISEPVQIGT
ncbi:MAG: aspartate dehydrogenase [Methanocellales archaeon]